MNDAERVWAVRLSGNWKGGHLSGVTLKTPQERTMESIEQRIESDFTYHSPKPGQPELYTELREQAKALALKFAVMVPPSREQSLALTNLEQAIMWANAGIARHG